VSLKILLADDSLTAQNMGKKILTEAGYEVIAVSNGAQAMKKIASDRPDLVVLDVYMPGYTGLELCERMRNSRETARTPVVLSVGKMEPFKPEEGTRVRADGLIVKPFEATELVAIVKKLAESLASAPYAKPSAEPEEAPQTTAEYSYAPAEPEFEIQHSAIEIPSEFASTPAIGMELIPEEPQETVAPVVAASTSAEPIEFEVEREVEPAAFDSGPRMTSAAGLSGVFELEPSAPPAIKTSIEPAATEVFERFSTPTGAPAPSLEVASPLADALPTTVAHEFPGDEPESFASEVQLAPHAPASEPETWPAVETGLSEYAVERFDHVEPEAGLQSATPLPELTSWEEPSSQPVRSLDWAIPEPETTFPPEVPQLSAQPEAKASAAERLAVGAVWVAEETEVEPHESALSLHEQMQREASVSQPSAPADTPVVGDEAAALSWEAPEPLPAGPGQEVTAPSSLAQPEPLPEFEPSWQAASAEEQAQIQGADHELAGANFPEPPAPENPEPAAEPALELDHYAGDPVTVGDYVGAIPEPELQTLPRVIEAPVDPLRVARIVDEVLARLKPELIAAVTRELEKEQ